MTKPIEKTFMNKKNLVAVGAALMLTACGGSQKTAQNTAPEVVLSEQLVMSTLWMQQSYEAPYLMEQSYRQAIHKLKENMARANDGRQRAIIVDIDETVLDNSPYEARLIEDKAGYSPGSWAEWVNQASARPVPGAQRFLSLAARGEVEVFYISNRSRKLLAATMENLKSLDFPNVDPDHVLLKESTSDKTARREQVMSRYHVVLLVGDQMTDFNEEYEQFLEEPALRDSLERYFVLLPNPMYGGFEDKAYHGETELTDSQKSALRKKALDKNR